MLERKSIVAQLRRDLQGMTVKDNAQQAQRAVAEQLQKAGWRVRREVKVTNLTLGGKWGRIDLVAKAPGSSLEIAIEIDRKSPRRKSLTKLRRWNAGPRIAILRDPEAQESVPLGLDDCIVLKST